MDAAEITALIERYDRAWNEQDIETVAALHTDDVVFANHTAGEVAEGAAAVRDHIAQIFANWPDLRFRGRSFRVGPDFAVSEWTATATTADGRRLEWDGVDVFPLRDGKIARKDVYSGSANARVL
jgi:steroid delta-isomerase-like uncharacterized protein